jgi:dTDP-4-dehydrorhamnose 3,5-epimerase
MESDIFCDDRGYVSFWNDFNLQEKSIKRFYIVENHKSDYIRAWHGHKEEEKYIFCLQGACEIVSFYKEDWDIYNNQNPIPVYFSSSLCDISYFSAYKKYFLSDKSVSYVHVDKNSIHGIKTLRPDTKLIIFSTMTIEESKADFYHMQYYSYQGQFFQDNYR